jgi:hypothetical protein
MCDSGLEERVASVTVVGEVDSRWADLVRVLDVARSVGVENPGLLFYTKRRKSATHPGLRPPLSRGDPDCRPLSGIPTREGYRAAAGCVFGKNL